MRIRILFVIAVAVPQAPLQAAAVNGNLLNSRELSAIFANGGLNVSRLEAEPLPPAAQAPVPGSIEELCGGQQLCFLDAYVPAPGPGQRIPPYFLEFYQNFVGYGQDLNKDEAKKIGKGFENLNQTFIGSEICKELGGGECSVASLAERGIIIKAGEPASNYPASTKLWGGKVLITISRNAKFDKYDTYYWGAILAHELSHAQDYKKYKYGFTEPYRWDSETKAYLYTLQAYHEIKFRYPRKVKNPLWDFLIQVWAWKDNKGPYPQDFEFGGTEVIAKDFIRENIDPAVTGVEVIRNATRNYFYYTHPMQEGYDPSDRIHYELWRDIGLRSEKYNKWNRDPLMYIPPPQPGNGSESPGGHGNTWGGSGGGGGNPPSVHPPDFGEGTGLDHPGAGNI